MSQFLAFALVMGVVFVVIGSLAAIVWNLFSEGPEIETYNGAEDWDQLPDRNRQIFPDPVDQPDEKSRSDNG